MKIANGKVCGEYESYKDSGVEWIGKIPSGWEVKKLKYIADTFLKGSGITKDEIKKLTSGVEIDGYTTKPCSIETIEISEKLSKLRITITEGKNRQIRKMFESVNKNVIFLRRVQIGEIRLGGLSRGEYTQLNSKLLLHTH